MVMAADKSNEMYTAGKLAKALGIQPDEVKQGCKYYDPATLEKLKAALEKE